MVEHGKIGLEARRWIALGVVGAIVLFLGTGLIRLQVIQHAELAERSENNRVRVVPIPPRRGYFYDREGRLVVSNRPSYTLAVIPAESSRETIPRVADLIGLDTAAVRERIRKNLISRYQPSQVKVDLPFGAVAQLEEQAELYPGVSYILDRVREYPADLRVESFIGYVDEVDRRELDTLDGERYHLGSMIGKKGLERSYDRTVRGREGTEFIEVYASGQVLGPYTERPSTPPEPGNDLELSIDIDVQRTAAQALQEFCCGAVVAMEPSTGDVLAMVSYPGYDPNIFSSVVSDSLWQALTSDSTHPLLNRPLNGQYAPGSTTKLITIGAGLEEGIIIPSSVYEPCYGGMQFGNRYFRCWYAPGHGTLDAIGAIEHSCNVYMYQLGLQLGIDKLADYFDRCGFGVPTGIDIAGESRGNVPNSAYYNKRYGERQWTRALVLNNAIGQGEILTTPLQLASFYCGLANGGVVNEPRLVRATIDHRTGRPTPMPIDSSYSLPFSDQTLDYLIESLARVVEGEEGTARSLKNDYYRIGGKTGTAQNPHGDPHSWFVGLAPVDDPQIVVAVIVENAGHGSEVAAPIAADVIQSYLFKQFNIVPEPELSLTVDDTTGLP